MNTAIDREALTAILERFWGTTNVQRLSCGKDELPTATVACKELWEVNNAVADLIGEDQCERVEFDLDGAMVYFADRVERIPFADAVDDVA